MSWTRWKKTHFVAAGAAVTLISGQALAGYTGLLSARARVAVKDDDHGAWETDPDGTRHFVLRVLPVRLALVDEGRTWARGFNTPAAQALEVAAVLRSR